MNNGCPICGLIHAPCEFRRGRPGVFPMRSVKRSRSATIATRWRNRRCGATVRGKSVRSPDAPRSTIPAERYPPRAGCAVSILWGRLVVVGGRLAAGFEEEVHG